MSLIAIKPNRCVQKLIIFVLFCKIVFRIRVRHKKFNEKAISKEHFMLKYCLHKLKSLEMCKEAATVFLKALKFAPNRFFTNKMLAKLDDVVSSNDDIVFVHTDFFNFTFFNDDMGLVNIDLINVSVDDDNFANDDPETIIHVRLAEGNKNWSELV